MEGAFIYAVSAHIEDAILLDVVAELETGNLVVSAPHAGTPLVCRHLLTTNAG